MEVELSEADRYDDMSASGTEAVCACEPPSDGPRPARMKEESPLLDKLRSSELGIREEGRDVETELARRRTGCVEVGEEKAEEGLEGTAVGNRLLGAAAL